MSIFAPFTRKIFDTKHPGVEDMETTSREVELGITPHHVEFQKAVTQKIVQEDLLYKKCLFFHFFPFKPFLKYPNRLCDVSKKLVINFNDVSNHMFNLGTCFGDLYKVSQRFNNMAGEFRNQSIDDLYMTLNHMMVGWGNHTAEQIKIIQELVASQFDYSHFEINSFKECLIFRHSVCNEYYKAKSVLDEKKKKLFNLGDTSKWEVKEKGVSREELLKNKELAMRYMLPRETDIVQEMRDFFGFFNSQFKNEIKNALVEKHRRYSENFSALAVRETEALGAVKPFLLWKLLIQNGFKRAATYSLGGHSEQHPNQHIQYPDC
jgi:hypothetical protein